MLLTCKQCGKEFELTDSEIEFYNSKNLVLPKRCKECRAANKQQRKNTTRENHPVTEPKARPQVSQEECPEEAPKKKSGFAAFASKSRMNRILAGIVALIALVVGTLTGTDLFQGNNDPAPAAVETQNVSGYYFRNDTLLEEHYEKHGVEMGFQSPEEYEAAAQIVVSDPKALHKTEKEDGDDVYYLEATNEFVIVSKDGYLRTYFYPADGLEYFNRQ